MARVREPAVAGTFYPADAATLAARVEGHLEATGSGAPASVVPKILIAPHAGYDYSGPVAASAFACLAGRRHIERVVLIGPSHHLAFEGIASSAAHRFATPLGSVPVDRGAVAEAERHPIVRLFEPAHEREHSLEVELPFLQRLLPTFELVPLVFGDVDPGSGGALLDALWGGAETLIVVSSDLSHFLDYAAAQQIDAETNRRIVAGRTDLDARRACGHRAINAALWAARERSTTPALTLDLRNSGDTAGPRDRVVGYGAWALAQSAAAGSATPA